MSRCPGVHGQLPHGSYIRGLPLSRVHTLENALILIPWFMEISDGLGTAPDALHE